MYYQKNKKIILQQRKVYYKINKKKVLNKRKLYYKKYKEKIKLTHKAYYKKHKIQRKLKDKIYYLKNKKKHLENKRKYYQENKQKLKKQHIKYYKKNKQKLNKLNQIYKKNRLKKDINFKILDNLRCRLYIALKNNYKKTSTIKLLGCTIPKLKQHLQKQFKKGMNWDNWSVNGWHIDHIKPCVSFNLSKKSEQFKCFNYKNLQPLWAIENLKKGVNNVRKYK